MKTCPFTILASLAIILGFLVNTFFSYTQETYFIEESISDNLLIVFGLVVGVLVLEQLFAKEPKEKLHKLKRKVN